MPQALEIENLIIEKTKEGQGKAEEEQLLLSVLPAACYVQRAPTIGSRDCNNVWHVCVCVCVLGRARGQALASLHCEKGLAAAQTLRIRHAGPSRWISATVAATQMSFVFCCFFVAFHRN